MTDGKTPGDFLADNNLRAKEARQSSRAGLLDAIELGERTRAVTERIEALHRANHFGPLIERSMRPW